MRYHQVQCDDIGLIFTFVQLVAIRRKLGLHDKTYCMFALTEAYEVKTIATCYDC